MPSALAAKLSPKTAALELLLTEELWANSVYFDSCKKKKKILDHFGKGNESARFSQNAEAPNTP